MSKADSLSLDDFRKRTSFGVYQNLQFPTTEHWAIITFGTCPDSYDKSTVEPCISCYTAYIIQAEWEQEIITMTERGDKNFVAVKVSAPAKTKTVISVES